MDVVNEGVILDMLEEDPTVSNIYGTEIHKDLAVRLEHVATHELNKEVCKELLKTYYAYIHLLQFLEKYLQDTYFLNLLPSNCKLINTPALNADLISGHV